MKYRELKRRLRAHGIEEDATRGKGSHRVFRRGEVFYPVPYHGANQDVRPSYVRDLERLFEVDLGG